MIKWTKQDVIDAFDKAMNTPQPGALPEDRHKVLETLIEQARAKKLGGMPSV